MSKFYNLLKTIMMILVILSFLPSIFNRLKKSVNDQVSPKNKVGMVLFNRVIMNSNSWNKQLYEFFKDNDIKAIILNIESPGGCAGASDAICSEILYLKQKYPKPVVAYIENMGASAAYQIATCADYIVASGGALVGSIGSKIPTQWNVKEFLAQYNITTYEFASSPYKNAGDPLSPMTLEQKAMLESVVADSAASFVKHVASQRHLDIAEQQKWAEGKVFTGPQALSLKLIDQIGNLRTAIDYLKKQILHSDYEIEIVKKHEPSKVQRLFYDCDDCDDEYGSISYSFWSSLFSYLENRSIRLH